MIRIILTVIAIFTLILTADNDTTIGWGIIAICTLLCAYSFFTSKEFNQ